MAKKPAITLLVSNYISFLHQARSLAIGFEKLGYKINIVALDKNKLKETYDACTGNVIISIGSWRIWPFIYREPVKLGKKVFPWLVSDDRVSDFIGEMNEAPVIFTTSEYCKYTFEKAGVESRVLRIIPEGIDADFWKPVSGKEKSRFKNIFSLPGNNKKTVLLTVGGDGTSKGAQEVLSALGEDPSLDIFYLIKTMPSEDAFFEGLKEKNLIKKYQLKDKVDHLMGYFSDETVRYLFNACDIYVAPSRHEGFGLPHIQAMACGKPVITCRGTAAEETSLNGVTGYVVSGRETKWENAAGYTVEGVKADIKELKEAIQKLVLDKKLREKMGKNARKHVLNNYESKKIAKIFIKKLEL